MMGDKQSQKGGDSSQNIQAGGDITVGLSYTEARQVAMDTFRANFLKLRDEAASIVYERAELFLDSFLRRMANEGQKEIPEGKNPDFQVAFYQAQTEYARSGDQDLGDLLVQVLADRTKERSRNLTQIVLNESLTVAPKLTADQLDALSLIFCIRYASVNPLEGLYRLHTFLEGLIDKFVLPFVEAASRKDSAYQHLEFAGCGSISVTEIRVEKIYRKGYPGLFCEGFTEEEVQGVGLAPEVRSQLIIPSLHNGSLLQVNAPNDAVIDTMCSGLGVDPEKAKSLKQLQAQKVMPQDKVKDYLVSVRPRMAQLIEAWDDTPMKNMTLTSVGIAIAHANFKRQIGDDSSLSIWI